MSSHDERVVEMRFDNAQFERGVRESMKTIDQFEKSLKFDEAIKGFGKIERASGDVSLSGLQKGIDAAITGFNALSAAGVLAMAKIASSIVDAGKSFAMSFIQPMQAGFSEYETQMNAVQTILTNTSSKGTTIDDVNNALDELNKYADQTIYNFTQMTENIGRFTAAGVGLDDSVTAIKGISNLAAASGSDANQAARAMYNLSQAISMGKLTLMDWNSVTNAGMGGELFQESLKETARVHGVAVDDIIEKQGSFRDSLSEGWVTSEILLETLSKFTGDLTREELESLGYTEEQIEAIEKLAEDANDAATKVKTYTQLMDTLAEENQSGWTQSWEIIIGDFEEAKEFWSGIAKITTGVISEMSNARNEFLEAVFGGTPGLISRDTWTEYFQVDNGNMSVEFLDALQKRVEASGISIDELTEKYGTFMGAVMSGEVVTQQMVEDTINGVGITSAASLDQIKELVDNIEEGLYGDGDERRRALEEMGYSYEALQALVDADWDGYTFGHLDWDNLTEDQLRELGVTEEQIEAFKELQEQMNIEGSDVYKLLNSDSSLTGRQMLVDSVTNAVQAGADVLHLFGEVWNEVFPPEGPEGIKHILEGILEFTKSFQIFTRTYDEEGNLIDTQLTEFGEKVKIVFTGIADAFGIVFDVFGSVSEFIGGIIDGIFGELFQNTEDKSPIDYLVEYAQGISQLRDDLQDGTAITKLIEKISDALQHLGEIGETVISSVKDLFSGNVNMSTVGKIGGVLGILAAVALPLLLRGGTAVTGGGALLGLAAAGGIIGLISSGLFGTDEEGRSNFDKLKDMDIGAFIQDKLVKGTKAIGETFRNFGDLIGFHPIDMIKGLFANIRDSEFGQAVSGFISRIKQKFIDLTSGIDFNPKEAFNNAINGIKEFFSNLNIDFSWFNGEDGLLSKFDTFKKWITGESEDSPVKIDFSWFTDEENGLKAKIKSLIPRFEEGEFKLDWFNGEGGLLSKFEEFKDWITGNSEDSPIHIDFSWFTDEENGLSAKIREIIPDVNVSEIDFSWFNGPNGLTSKFDEIKKWITGDEEDSPLRTDFKLFNDFKSKVDDIIRWVNGLKQESEEDGGDKRSLGDILNEKLGEIQRALEAFAESPVVQTVLDILQRFPIILGLIAVGVLGSKVKKFFGDLADAIQDFLSKDENGTAYFKFLAIATGITELCAALYMVKDLDDVGSGFRAIFGSLGALLAGNLLTGLFSGKLGATFNIGTALADMGLAEAIKILVGVIKELAEVDQTPEEIQKASEILHSMGHIIDEVALITGGGKLTGMLSGATKKASAGLEIGGANISSGFGDLEIAVAIKIIAETIKEISKESITESDAKTAVDVLTPMVNLIEKMSLLCGGFNGLIDVGGLKHHAKFNAAFAGASAGSGVGTYMYAYTLLACFDVVKTVKESDLTVDDMWKAISIIGPMVIIASGTAIIVNRLAGINFDSTSSKFWQSIGTGLGFDAVIMGIAQLAKVLSGLEVQDIDEKSLEKIVKIVDAVKSVVVTSMAGMAILSVIEYFTKAKSAFIGVGAMITGLGLFVSGIGELIGGIADLTATYIENKDAIEEGGQTLGDLVNNTVGSVLDSLTSEEHLDQIGQIASVLGGAIGELIPDILGALAAAFPGLADLGVTIAEILFPPENVEQKEAADTMHTYFRTMIDILMNGTDDLETYQRLHDSGEWIAGAFCDGIVAALIKMPMADRLVPDFWNGFVRSWDDGELLKNPITNRLMNIADSIPIVITRDVNDNVIYRLQGDPTREIQGEIEELYNANGKPLYINYTTGELYIDVNGEGYVGDESGKGTLDYYVDEWLSSLESEEEHKQEVADAWAKKINEWFESIKIAITKTIHDNDILAFIYDLVALTMTKPDGSGMKSIDELYEELPKESIDEQYIDAVEEASSDEGDVKNRAVAFANQVVNNITTFIDNVVNGVLTSIRNNSTLSAAWDALASAINIGFIAFGSETRMPKIEDLVSFDETPIDGLENAYSDAVEEDAESSRDAFIDTIVSTIGSFIQSVFNGVIDYIKNDKALSAIWDSISAFIDFGGVIFGLDMHLPTIGELTVESSTAEVSVESGEIEGTLSEDTPVHVDASDGAIDIDASDSNAEIVSIPSGPMDLDPNCGDCHVSVSDEDTVYLDAENATMEVDISNTDEVEAQGNIGEIEVELPKGTIVHFTDSDGVETYYDVATSTIYTNENDEELQKLQEYIENTKTQYSKIEMVEVTTGVNFVPDVVTLDLEESQYAYSIDEMTWTVKAINLDTGEVIPEMAITDQMAKDIMADGVAISSDIFAGIQQGIDEGSIDATTVRQKTIEAFKVAFDINSPSKVMIPIGKDIVDGVALGIERNGRILRATMEKIKNAILSVFSSGKSKYPPIGTGLISGFAHGILSGKESVYGSIDKVTDGLTGFLKRYTKKETATFSDHGKKLMFGLGSGVNSKSSIDKVCASAGNVISSMFKEINKSENIKTANTSGQKLIFGVSSGISAKTTISNVVSSVSSVMTSLFGEINKEDNKKSASDSGKNLIMNFSSGVNNKETNKNVKDNVQVVVKGLIDKITEKKNLNDISSSGTTLMFGLGSGINNEETKDNAKEASQKVVKSAIDQITDTKNLNSISGSGESLVKSLNGGLTSETSQSNLKSAADSIISSIKGSLENEDNPTRLWGIGLALARGLANGINSQQSNSYLTQAAEAVSSVVQSVVGGWFEVGSPSKLFRRMGKWLPIGLGIGIEDGIRNAVNSASKMSNSVIDAVRNSASLIDSILDSDMDTSPTITPVVDLSNLQNVNSLMDNTFRSRSVALAYNASISEEATIDPIDRLMDRLYENDIFGSTNIYMDGATLNDDEAMRAVTLDFLYGLKRKAVL